MPLQIRRGSDAERRAMAQPLAQGELLYVTDDQRLYIGNGTTLGGLQITGYRDEDAQDAAASIFSNVGIHSGISFSYSSLNKEIAATVNLSSYTGTITATTITAGAITAGAFKGTVVSDDSTILVDGVSGVLRGELIGTLTGNVNGNLTGNVNGNLTGIVTGDIIGSVLGENSTVLIDATSNTVAADVINENVSTGILNVETVNIDRNLSFGGLSIRTQGDTQIDDFDLFNVTTANASANTNFASFSRSRGTIESPTACSPDDGIFSFLFAGHSNVGFEVAAAIEVAVDGSVGDFTPGIISFQTSDGADNLVSRLTINSKGTSAFTGMMQMATFADETAASAAVGGVLVNGMMYYDTALSKVRAVAGGIWIDLH